MNTYKILELAQTAALVTPAALVAGTGVAKPPKAIDAATAVKAMNLLKYMMCEV